MKRIFYFAFVLGTAAQVWAQADSISLQQLQEVTIQGVSVQNDAPFAVTDIDRKELDQFTKTGRELPFLFARTPGVLAWSENGVGTGTTYLRIRGAADSRINVTLDGVPLNSPEDQAVFWANMNSYSALLGSAQIQRGVGTSTNGDGAFGGNIVLSTKAPSPVAGGQANISYGSFNTINAGADYSTGLIGKHLILDGAYHQTTTDGYINGTSGRSGNYYAGATWIADNLMIRYKNIGNFERTGQAWNGVTAGNDDLSLMDGTYGASGFRNYADMYDAGLGKYNSLYEMLATDGNGDFIVDADGKYQTVRYTMNNGKYWDKTTDNFWQDHNILSLSWDINDQWSTSASLHYTYGYGYYEEFRYNNKLKKFGLPNFVDSNGNTVKKSDFVRKKGLKQNTFGAVWNARYVSDSFDFTAGLAEQQFIGNHFGFLTYVSNPELDAYLRSNGQDYTYYDSDASKYDFNGFVKADWHLTESIDLFGDLQYRYVQFLSDGYNDKFIDNGDGTYGKHWLDIDKQYSFVNPKAGISFHKNGHKAFATVALSGREPERNNFTDNGNNPAPKAEHLTDFELGYIYAGNNWFINLNGYYMDYTNQFVQTGQKSDIGENLTTNIKDSYRAGIEMSAGVSPLKWLSFEGNAALSQNRIKDFDEYVEDWDNGTTIVHYDNSTLAYSPSAILNGFVTLHGNRWAAEWHTGYVSRQYLDNSENKERSLDAYCVSDVQLSYRLPVKRVLKEIDFALNLNNVFNTRYASSGWVYSAICESYGHSNDNRYYQIGYIPMAGFNAMGSITVRF